MLQGKKLEFKKKLMDKMCVKRPTTDNHIEFPVHIKMNTLGNNCQCIDHQIAVLMLKKAGLKQDIPSHDIVKSFQYRVLKPFSI